MHAQCIFPKEYSHIFFIGTAHLIEYLMFYITDLSWFAKIASNFWPGERLGSLRTRVLYDDSIAKC